MGKTTSERVTDYTLSNTTGGFYLSPLAVGGGRILIAPEDAAGVIEVKASYRRAYDTVAGLAGIVNAHDTFTPTLALNTDRMKYLKAHSARLMYTISRFIEDPEDYIPVDSSGVIALDALYEAPNFDAAHLGLIDRLRAAGYTQGTFQVVIAVSEPVYGAFIEVCGVR